MHFGTFHWHFDNNEEETNEMLNQLIFGLTGIARLKELSKNNKAYKWTLQIQDKEGNWFNNGTMGLMNFNFLTKPDIKYLQNDLLPKERLFEEIETELNNSIENVLEPKKEFHKKIESYFLNLSDNRIPIKLLEELIDKITSTEYENYQRFWTQYPKSRKRYSRLKLEDLEHPFIKYQISDFFKANDFDNYEKFSLILLKMTPMEFKEYEINKYNYETK